MNYQEISIKFSFLRNNSEYIRVSVEHPLELYIGLNDQGLKTLRYNGEFEPVKVLGTSILDIKQVKTSSSHSILFSFNSKENEIIFYKFCEDLISSTENYNGKNGYSEIINRYNQWKKMFYGKANLLSENEIMGLIGELIFIKDIASKVFGIHDAIKGWSGPEPTHKDFSYNLEWYEIKTIGSMKSTVKISSIEQLDSKHIGQLYVYILEKMSPNFNGLSLNKIVNQILDLILLDVDKDLFKTKLSQVGYIYNEEYDNYVFSLINLSKYLVTEDFPRIKYEDIPKEITKVTYEIELNMLDRFKVI